MQTAPFTYARALAARSKAPVYLVEFDGIPTRFSTAPVLAPLGAYNDTLMIPSGAGSTVTPDEGKASIATLTFSIMDDNGQITALLPVYQMANRMVTLKTGFQGIPEAQYLTLFKGRVLNYTLESDAPFYKFQTTDLQRDAKAKIFNAVTKLTLPALAGDGTLTVSNTGAFPSATAGVCYLLVDQEAISYTGTTPTSFTGCTRGALGTVAAGYSAGTEARNLVVLQGNPLTLALQILTSTGLGTNGVYDILPACAGLAIPQALVNIAKFESERNRWTSGMIFRFEESADDDGKAWIQSQLYQFVPAYPLQDNQGRFSVKVQAPPLPTTIAQPLTDDNLTARPNFSGNVLDRYFFNELDFSYNWDWISQTYASRDLYEDANSQVEFDAVKTKTIESRGIRSSLMTASRIEKFGLQFLKRYAKPAPTLTAKAFFRTRLLEVGDVIPLTSSKLPNLVTGRLGVDGQLVEIIGITPQYSEGALQYSLLQTAYTYGKKYAAFSPSSKPPVSFPTWNLATAAQRAYAFFSNRITPTRGIMSDGSDGYYFTP